jgi:hypothetical protein
MRPVVDCFIVMLHSETVTRTHVRSHRFVWNNDALVGGSRLIFPGVNSRFQGVVLNRRDATPDQLSASCQGSHSLAAE